MLYQIMIELAHEIQWHEVVLMIIMNTINDPTRKRL